MLRLTACLLLACCVVLPAWAGEAPDAEELTVLLHEFMTGASKNDLKAHDRFWSDDLVYTSSTGDRYGKQDIIDALVEALDADEQGADVTYLAENIRVQQYGDAAVIAFRLIGVTHDAEDSGRPRVDNYFNTGTFIRHDGDWRAVAWQATRIPDD